MCPWRIAGSLRSLRGLVDVTAVGLQRGGREGGGRCLPGDVGAVCWPLARRTASPSVIAEFSAG